MLDQPVSMAAAATAELMVETAAEDAQVAEPKAAATPVSVAATLEADVEEVQPALMAEAGQALAREAALTATAARVKASEEDPMATADVAAEVTAVAHLAETRSSQLQCH